MTKELLQLGGKDEFPPFLIEKKDERLRIEENPYVASLISSNLLLNKELNVLLNEFLTESRKIQDLINFEFREIFPLLRRDPKITENVFGLFFSNRKGKGVKLSRRDQIALKYTNQKIADSIKSSSKKMQANLLHFERRVKKKIDILEHKTAYCCSNCKTLICMDKFTPKTCKCQKELDEIDQAEEITFAMFNEAMMKFIKENMWLEHGLDYLFRKNNHTTRCGVYVAGHSGKSHEIDNIAYNHKTKTILFAECKTAVFGVNELFILYGKMLDVGCSRGITFAVAKIDSDIKSFAKTKNILIVDTVLDRHESEIIKEITTYY